MRDREWASPGHAQPAALRAAHDDLDPGDLPTKSDGSVDEEGAGLDAVGEIEEFKVGTTQRKAFDLTAGGYVLICNVVEKDEGKTEAHYQLGMRTAFTVG
jgi:hypothetical protein